MPRHSWLSILISGAPRIWRALRSGASRRVRMPISSRTTCGSRLRATMRRIRRSRPIQASMRPSISFAGCTFPAPCTREPNRSWARTHTRRRRGISTTRVRCSPLDPALSASVTITVDGFEKNGVQLGFTRGFVQSQAFVRHFGLKAPIRPKGNDLVFDTTQEAGVNAAGERFTFQDEYEWLGFTAREKIFELLNEVVQNKNLKLDVFAYDL